MRSREVAELAEAIAKANTSDEADSQSRKELRRYERKPEGVAEAKEELRMADADNSAYSLRPPRAHSKKYGVDLFCRHVNK